MKLRGFMTEVKDWKYQVKEIVSARRKYKKMLLALLSILLKF